MSNHEYPTVNRRMMWLPYIADHNDRHEDITACTANHSVQDRQPHVGLSNQSFQRGGCITEVDCHASAVFGAGEMVVL